MTHTSTEQPVAYLWQHTITGQTKALMRDDVFTAGPHWRLVGPLVLATESGQAVHMATASVPVAATHWRKAQALPELMAAEPSQKKSNSPEFDGIKNVPQAKEKRQ